MTLGTGLFLSVIVMATVLLFAITKDRWNWGKLLKRLGITLLILIGVGIALYFAWDPIIGLTDRPKPFYELGGIKLGTSKEDVKFLKGIPETTCTDKNLKDWVMWAYRLTPKEDQSPTFLVVTFQGNHGVWTIFPASPDHTYNNAPTLDRVNTYSTFESIDKRFGPASSVTPSEDGLSRNYSYRRYNLRVEFAQGHLTNYGIFYHPGEPDLVPFAPGSDRVCVTPDEDKKAPK